MDNTDNMNVNTDVQIGANPKKRKVLNRRFNAKGVKHISYRCDRSVLCDRSVRCDTVSHL